MDGTHGTTSTTSRAGDRTAVQKAALVVGAAFLLVGILGFVPGITTDFDTLKFASHDSDAKLLGIFEVSVLHNLVHLLFGVLGIALSRSISSARSYLRYGGVVYLLLWVYGLLIDKDSSANFVPVNSADDWLHFVLGAAMVALSVVLTKDHRAADGNRA